MEIYKKWPNASSFCWTKKIISPPFHKQTRTFYPYTIFFCQEWKNFVQDNSGFFLDKIILSRQKEKTWVCSEDRMQGLGMSKYILIITWPVQSLMKNNLMIMRTSTGLMMSKQTTVTNKTKDLSIQAARKDYKCI